MINGDPSGSAVLVNNLDAGNPLHMNPNDSTMSSDVYMGLVYSIDAASMWKELESTYDKVDGSVIDACLICSSNLTYNSYDLNPDVHGSRVSSS
ncbi:hypothetical protein Tco_0960486 [Tanacetum coccineum]